MEGQFRMVVGTYYTRISGWYIAALEMSISRVRALRGAPIRAPFTSGFVQSTAIRTRFGNPGR